MFILSAIAVALHAVVLLRGGVFLHKGINRCGDRNAVIAIMWVSVLYVLAQLVVWSAPTSALVYAGGGASLLVAHSIATAALFLALIGCFTHYSSRGRRHG